MKKILLILIILGFSNKIFAQQDPQYTHYMYNMSVINPAYATASPNVINLGGLYRSQWVGSVGGPTTMTFFAHKPVNRNVELGVSFISDDIGDGAKKENSLFADFAYVLELNERHRLSLGLKAGAVLFNTNFNGFQLESGDNTTDRAFEKNINSVFPNVGAGAFYFTDTYYLGLSAPNLLSTKHIEERDGISRFGSENIHVFSPEVMFFQLNQGLKFKPSFMARAVKGAPVALDISSNFLINDRFELGASYRLDDSVSGLFNIKITPELRVGYSYDYTLSNLGEFNSGSHEVFLLFDLDFFKKGYDKSPRFF